ncbi:type VI secretion system secreted protein Hcp [Paraburkholderia terricola]|jgi:type VI secretion system secreted protein Hcp|uniref:Type VI secretion system secreted protein Hcp n=1 Tax=Paraburkholderia terricola TaxID=169427 RepID=A0A1M6MNK7_9BURK|nr:type VI secretion system secreted protein Hcp [Paraburkholderia sediminicola]SHJ84976.1 type VI secretion system secreted protein Hcp [Paraburkholderia terricola]
MVALTDRRCRTGPHRFRARESPAARANGTGWDPYLYKAVTSGQTLKSAEIRWYKIDDAGKEKEYFNTKLDNVKVVAVRPKMLDIKDPDYEKHNHLEEVELRYETITCSYKDGNIIHKDTWNERS